MQCILMRSGTWMQNAANASNQEPFRSHSQGSANGSLVGNSVHQAGKSRTGKHIPGLNRTVSSISIHSQCKLSLCRTHPHPSGNGVYIIFSLLLSVSSWRQNSFLSDLTSLFCNSEMKAQNNRNWYLPPLHVVLWAFALYFRDGTCFFQMFSNWGNV